MKILIASDIHGRVKAASRLEEIISEEKPDLIFLLGDFMYNGPRNGVPEDYEPMEVCQILNKHGSITYGCIGNCDSRIDRDLLKFACLEDIVYLDINGVKTALYHGDDYSIERLQGSQDLYISGHTHLYGLIEKDGALWLNPGSASFPKQDRRPSFAIWDDKGIRIKDLYSLETLLDYPWPRKDLAK